METKKILILVMGSKNEPYKTMMEKQMETWDSIDVENVKTMYFMASDKYDIEDNIIHIPVPESTYYLFKKTALAFIVACEKFEWDYILKTDNSAYIDKRELVRTISNLPTKKVYAGKPININMIRKDVNQYLFAMDHVWGEGMILSKDVVEHIIKESTEWKDGLEDVIIGQILKFNTPCTELPIITYKKGNELVPNHAYRCHPSYGTQSSADHVISCFEELHSKVLEKNGKEDRSS